MYSATGPPCETCWFALCPVSPNHPPCTKALSFFSGGGLFRAGSRRFKNEERSPSRLFYTLYWVPPELKSPQPTASLGSHYAVLGHARVGALRRPPPLGLRPIKAGGRSGPPTVHFCFFAPPVLVNLNLQSCPAPGALFFPPSFGPCRGSIRSLFPEPFSVLNFR